MENHIASDGVSYEYPNNMRIYDEFLEYCKDKTIAIVGSCPPSDPTKNLETEIENHDIVVRINTWHLFEDPQMFGRRTDVYCFNFYSKFPDLDTRREQLQWLLNTHSFEAKSVFSRNKSNHQHSREHVNPDKKHALFPEYIMSKFKYNSFPTSGVYILIGFIEMLSKIQKLSVYGLSFNLTDSVDVNKRPGSAPIKGDIQSHHNYKNDREFAKETIGNLTPELRDKIYIDNENLRYYITNQS